VRVPCDSGTSKILVYISFLLDGLQDGIALSDIILCPAIGREGVYFSEKKREQGLKPAVHRPIRFRWVCHVVIATKRRG
jgi:hypothetical protein